MVVGTTERRSAATRFGDIAFLEAGHGPAALFIHGVFLNADLWRHQLEGLADIRRCVAVDLLAHGESPCPASGELTMALQVEMILELLDSLGLDAVDLVGNDSGGAIAQLVAARAPERVRTLTLTNCDTHDNWPPAAFAPIRDMAQEGILADALGTLGGDLAAARASLASGLERPDDLPDDTIRGFFASFDASPARAEAIQDYVAGMDNGVTVAIRDDLARLLAPTLIVWGTADEFFDVTWARWLAQTIPGTVRFVALEGAKLFFPTERPEEFNRELRELWTHTEDHALLNRYLDAWNRHDLDQVVDAHSADTVLTLHTGAVSYSGTEAVRSAFRTDLGTWPDVKWSPIRRTVTAGVCVLESTITATAASPVEALGFTVDAGSTVRGSCVDLLTIKGGRIARKDTYFDVGELLASGATQSQ
jgi:pimeloyl-ACP methyl ester carboxylesterase/ketosteroid isomerase-like protein